MRDLAIGQLLGLAESRGVRVDVKNGRVVLSAPGGCDAACQTIKACLGQLGTDAVISYFNRHSADRRAALSEAA